MQNQKVVGVLVGGLVIGAALGAGVTMNMNKKGSVTGTSASLESCSVDGANSSGTALFEMNGKAVTRDELGTEARDVLYQIETQGYESKSNFVKELALRYSLAMEQNPNADLKNLPPLKTLLASGNISEDEMKKFFEANKQSLPPGTTYEQVKPQLEQFMTSQKVGEEARKKIADLESSGKFKLLLTQPVSPQVNLDLTGFATKGNDTAAVTLVEISDYLCPHCRSVKPEVDSVVQELGSQVKFVQVNFALRPAGLSGALARGGFCALQQSNESFWKYHDKAFEVSLDAATAVSPDEAKEFNNHAVTAAKDAGLDVAKFETCLTSDEAKTYVNSTNEKMSAVGVTGTPTFFVNDRKVSVHGPGSLKNAVQQALAQASAGNKAQ